MDIIGPEHRSALMSNIRGRDTKPELAVRRLAHAMGLRFRLHRRDLPGSPDLVFPRLRKTVFVHGCFWHRHARCRYAYQPKSRGEFWRTKFLANQRRDRLALAALEKLGWDALVVWECETSDAEALMRRLSTFLHNKKGEANRESKLS
jgi:DNA mismatch endonuclease, patch repair protein